MAKFIATAKDFRPAESILFDQADVVVASWVARDVQSPHHLDPIIRKYRDLVAYIDRPEVPFDDPAVAESDRAYERLLAAAIEKIRVSQRAEAQLRRLQRKQAERDARAYQQLSYQQKCDLAINAWRAGARA